MTSAWLIGSDRIAVALADRLAELSMTTQCSDPTAEAPAEPVDFAVIALATDDADLAGLDPLGWRDACERPFREARIALVSAYRALRERGGAVLLLLPEEGGSLTTSTVVEGVLALGTSAARAWEAEGIAVNFLSVSREALADDRRLREDVAPLIELMARAGSRLSGNRLRALAAIS